MMDFYVTLFSILFYIAPGKSRMTDCRLPGVLYRGYRNMTESGRSCQKWQTQTPHAHNYDVFRLAQENYCRNFDREEPWCFTIDPNVRWERCGVIICDTPCLNQSYYKDTTDITSNCLSETPTDTNYCNYMRSLVKCLKNRVENSSGVQCPQIDLKSIALRNRKTIEMLTRKSISECIISPCTDPRLTTDITLLRYAYLCNHETPVEKSTPDTLCRNVQRVSNCIISLVNDKSNSTCLVEDKIYLLRKVARHVPLNISPCISSFFSEPSQPQENNTVLAVNSDQDTTPSSDKAVAILTAEVVTIPSAFPVPTSRTTTSTTNINTDTSEEGVTFPPEFPVTLSRTTITTTSINTDTSGEGVAILSEFPATTNRTTTSTTNINTDTSGEGVAILSEFPATTSRTTITTTNINTDTSGKSRMTDCRLPGVLYRGYRNITESGRSCQKWQTQTPHAHNYDLLRLAQDNYCRNFDREEPWCFTNDPNVRWELCGVDVCDTPCLNQSYYNTDITSSCLSDTSNNTDYCKYIWSLVKCLKNRVENSAGVQCPQIQLKSIALRFNSTIEMLTRKSISECIISPCTDPRLTTLNGLIRYVDPCNRKHPVEKSTPDTLCRNVQRVSHCVLSLVTDGSNSTCLLKDKMYAAEKFLDLSPLAFPVNTSLCVSNFLSEFSPPIENTTVVAVKTGLSRATPSDQIVVILSVGFAIALIAIISIGVGLFKIRAKHLQKTARRLPRIPKKREHSYEVKLHYPEETSYLDPDYQTVEEINDGYQHLIGYKSDIGDDSGMNCDDRGSYVQPNEVHLGATITDEDENDKHHSYLQILECPEKMSFTNNDCTNVTELASTKCDNETITEQERKRTSEVNPEVSDTNQQETITLTDDNNSKENCDIEIVSTVNTVLDPANDGTDL
ncbi:uncharacterized protein LOC125673095 isoform X2 [Ostrea edulis]|uniref:uncharacterized protein LOC125673095 isoform X2 n=1 Tax=Ostrea edulis TaxID=37623 RepID=UPI0024AF9C38|nr:uncharacterized protein LOC125673095 isoform X2 [Ostrea edulis]